MKSHLAGEFTLPVRATDTPSEVGPVDLILFCVKTYDIETAAESIRPLIGADTMVLSLQNGVDNAERIAQIAGHESGLGAVAYVVSAIEAPGVVAQTAGPGKIVLGELAGGTLEETEAVARGGGIRLPEDCVEQASATAAAVEPWGRSSLYHDLDNGRRLELEALNGEVVRRGREHDIRTPLNFAIYAALRPSINGAPVMP